MPFIRNTARSFKRRHRDLGRDDVLSLVERLWRSSYHDLDTLVIALLELYIEQLSPDDIAVVEQLLRRSNTWDYVDWLSVRVAGALVERHNRAKLVLSR